MSDLTLFHFPGACSRVALNALEAAGLRYEDRTVDLVSGKQRSPEYLHVNPKGKVPALSVDGAIITENPAILHYLHTQHPSAGLLPASGDPVADMQGISDLIWCSATLHINVRQVVKPAAFTGCAEAEQSVRAKGLETFAPVAERLSKRFEASPWWFDEAWSILDVYLYWVYSGVGLGGFPLSDYPSLEAHATRVRSRPSFQRALAREETAVKRDGLQLFMGAPL